jgi:hypothetical protein
MEADIGVFVGFGGLIGALATIPWWPKLRDFTDEAVARHTSKRMQFIYVFNRVSFGTRLRALVGGLAGAAAGALVWYLAAFIS